MTHLSGFAATKPILIYGDYQNAGKNNNDSETV
jgi:hypothetical protein